MTKIKPLATMREFFSINIHYIFEDFITTFKNRSIKSQDFVKQLYNHIKNINRH